MWTFPRPLVCLIGRLGEILAGWFVANDEGKWIASIT